ncbi:MAG: AarF/ABC1/UbiB kinase family protein [Pirellulales bacterium]
MSIRSLPNLYRNVKRWTEILAVLSKYGLADWLSQTNVEFIKSRLRDKDGGILSSLSREARIRAALAELGPTFVKLGQLLSTRPDLVGVALTEELKSLQAHSPADHPAEVRRTIESELGQSLEELFVEFEESALASGSIGQVHAARLPTGERVVVKVQHAQIAEKIAEDLEILAGLAQLSEAIPELRPYRPVAVMAEVSRALRRELDFSREERNQQQFSELFRGDGTVVIPIVYSEYCTAKVLTMQHLDGIPLTNMALLNAQGFDCEELARRGANIYLKMIFTHGFYHADPHPGNIMILGENIIGLIDFGMVGRLDDRLREDIEEMLMALVSKDVPLLTRVIKRLGQVPPQLDDAGLSCDIADFVGHYSMQSLGAFPLAKALLEMMEIIRRYHIMLPASVTMLIKALVTLEGTSKQLSPSFSLIEVMQPFQKGMMLSRLSPKRQLKKLRRLYYEFEHLAEIMPQRIMQILEQVNSGKFDVHLDHRGLGPSVNRLVLGMLASALFVGSSLLMAYKVPPLLFEKPWHLGMHQISILDLLVAGCGLSGHAFAAIGKSGHLDQNSSLAGI